jgi:flagellar basal-body rod protein FlgC
MITGISSSISALVAFGKKMAVTANNVANLQSEGFKKSRVLLEEESHGGVGAQIESVSTPGVVITEENEQGMAEKELSNVDLEKEILETILTQRGYQANLKTAETEDEMLGFLLDTKE